MKKTLITASDRFNYHTL